MKKILSDLKVGDEVALRDRRKICIGTVMKITATGQITVLPKGENKNPVRFNNRGFEIGVHSYSSGWTIDTDVEKARADIKEWKLREDVYAKLSAIWSDANKMAEFCRREGDYNELREKIASIESRLADVRAMLPEGEQ